VFGAGSKTGSLLWWASLACLVGGGVLWALSPVGVELSETKFKTPEVFWKLFPSAPLLLAFGTLGLLFQRTEGRGLAARIGLWAALAGLLLVAAGAAGLFHLGVDDAYIMAAPAYHAFRAGLVLLAAGALLFAAAETRSRGLPTWVGLPFALSALAGLVAVSQDLGPFGAALWAVFGAGWVWLGLTASVEAIRPSARTVGRTGPPGMR
jgi:hypothetical protein